MRLLSLIVFNSNGGLFATFYALFLLVEVRFWTVSMYVHFSLGKKWISETVEFTCLLSHSIRRPLSRRGFIEGALFGRVLLRDDTFIHNVASQVIIAALGTFNRDFCQRIQYTQDTAIRWPCLEAFWRLEINLYQAKRYWRGRNCRRWLRLGNVYIGSASSRSLLQLSSFVLRCAAAVVLFYICPFLSPRARLCFCFSSTLSALRTLSCVLSLEVLAESA